MNDRQKNRFYDLLVLLLFCIMGGLLYGNTLDVPWLFDDIQNIVENPVIRSIPEALRRIWTQRGFAYLTFALNYRVGGMDVAGFHLVNIAIHINTSWLAYLLAKRAFCPTASDEAGDRGRFLARFASHASRFMAVAAGFIFLVHPVQTQAVNYIVQRMTSMSALFFLLALYAYVRFREAATVDRPSPYTLQGLSWYLLALAAATLALMTKQNAAVLPAGLFLVEKMILNRCQPPVTRHRLLHLLPFVMISCLFVFMQVGMSDVLLKDAGRAEYWTRANESSATKNLLPVPPPVAEPTQPVKIEKPPENLQLIYFATELPVLWLYMRLLVLPYGQQFDYGYPLVGRILNAESVLAGVGLALLALLACRISRRLPLAAFGIFWFFVTLAVESTIIPLDAAVEHRLYLPMFGFSLALVSLIDCLRDKRLAVLLLCLILAGYTTAARKRNLLWSNPVAFARDGVSKAPHNQRNHLTLANAYADAGRWSDAEATLRSALYLRPYYHIPYDNLGTALAQQGKLEQARRYYYLACGLNPGYPNAVYNYGVVSLRLGDMPEALRSLERLKQLNSPLARKLDEQVVIGR